jgi:hypothetical protein
MDADQERLSRFEPFTEQFENGANAAFDRV